MYKNIVNLVEIKNEFPVIHRKKWKRTRTCCLLLLAKVMVYLSQYSATICESLLLAAKLSTRDPPVERNYLPS